MESELLQAKGKLFEAFGSNVNNAILVLQSTMHEEESTACYEQAVMVIKVGMDDDI